jgi:hypothetical protein
MSDEVDTDESDLCAQAIEVADLHFPSEGWKACISDGTLWVYSRADDRPDSWRSTSAAYVVREVLGAVVSVPIAAVEVRVAVESADSGWCVATVGVAFDEVNLPFL